MSQQKAVTEIDVFDLYKRNKRYYDICHLAKKQCPSFYEECYCHVNVSVLPITIGDQLSSCNMRTKRYINPQEECSICLCQINKESDAYITNCGHSFHKSCLFTTYEINFYQHKRTETNVFKYFQFKCPICRKHIISPDFYCRYPQWCVLPDKRNYLDVLEEFWLSKDYNMVQLCCKSNDAHYLGMKKNCGDCAEYRNSGRI